MKILDDLHNLDSIPHAGLFPEVTDAVLAGGSLDIPSQATHARVQFQEADVRETTDHRVPAPGGPGAVRRGTAEDEVWYPLKDFRDARWVREGSGNARLDIEFYKPVRRRA